LCITETKIAETKIAETKIAETKIAETKIAETKIAETKIAETKIAETKIILTSTRRLSLIAVSLFVSTFVSDGKLAKLPLQFLLKDRLHVAPELMAAFFGLTGLAWYFKPLAGLLSDAVPLRGSRRRNYLLLSGLGAGLLWALLGLVPHGYGPLVWTLVAANAFAVVASSVSGGLLVEEGQRQGLTGRLGSLRETIIAGSSLLAQPVGGFLAERAFGWTCGVGAVLFLGLLPAALCLLPKERAAVRKALFAETLKAQMGPVFRSRGLWLATAFIFLKELSPGFGTPLFYIQTNVLHFSKLFLGGLGAVFNGAAVAGALVYALLCLRLPLGRLLPGAIVLSAAGSLLFLGYHSHSSALTVQGVSGFLGIFASVALMDLAARTTPVGGEALGYSLLMSAFNLGLTGSDILGAWLYSHHLSFAALVWLSAGTTLLALPLMRLIPAEALARPDR